MLRIYQLHKSYHHNQNLLISEALQAESSLLSPPQVDAQIPHFAQPSYYEAQTLRPISTGPFISWTAGTSNQNNFRGPLRQ